MRADRTTLPRPRGLRPTVGAIALVVVATFGLSACGDDVPSEAEYTSKIGTVTGGKVTPDLAECVYRKLGKSDGELLLKSSQTPNLTEAEDKLLSYTLSQCIIEQYEQDNPKKESTTTTTEDDRS